MNPIRILVIPPEASPYPTEIPHTLAAMQSIVGGDIEALYPFDDPVGIICAESGKLVGLPPNRALRDSDGKIYDVIAGTFFLAGLDAANFTSLPDDLLEKYTNRFRFAEIFIKVNGEIHAISYDPKESCHV